MLFKKVFKKNNLKNEQSYLSNQQELESYRRLGITEYKFIASACDCEICENLNGKVFFINDAEVGVNLPPMHPSCKSIIVAKTQRDLFKNREGENPLKDNPKFEAWKNSQKDSN